MGRQNRTPLRRLIVIALIALIACWFLGRDAAAPSSPPPRSEAVSGNGSPATLPRGQERARAEPGRATDAEDAAGSSPAAHAPESVLCIVTVRRSEDRAPLAGARVRVLGPGKEPLVGHADADGVAELRAPPGGCRIEVWHAGHMPYLCHTGLSRGQPWRQEVLLDRAARLRLRVVRASDGTPVPDAAVSVRSGGSEPGGTNWRLGDEIARGKTAQDGTWAFGEHPTRIATTIEVQAPGYALARATGFADEARSIPLVVELAAESSVRGLVTYADGTPAAGGRVRVRPHPFTAAMRWKALERVVQTAADGSYLVGGLQPDGVYELRVHVHGIELTARELLAGGETAHHERNIRVPPLTPVHVRVLGSDGAPVRSDEYDVEAEIWLESRLPGATDVTAEVGQAEIYPPETMLLPPGTYHARVMATAEHPGADRTFTVTDAAAYELDLVLDAPVPVGGMLRTRAGDPAPDREVELTRESGTRLELSTDTDASGVFRFVGASAGDWVLHVVTEEGPDLVRGVRVPCGEITLQELPATGIRLRLPPEARGRPCVVRHWGPPHAARRDEAAPRDCDSYFGNWGSDERIEYATPGRQRVNVSVAGFQPWTAEFEVGAGETHDLVVGPLVRGTPVRGRASDPEGNPLEGVSVALIGTAAFPASTTTRPDGRFDRLTAVPGPVRLQARRIGWAPKQVEFLADGSPVELELVLHRGGRVVVRTEFDDGQTAPGREHRVDTPRDTPFLTPRRSDHRGRCVWLLPPGTWRFVADGAKPVDVRVVDGEESRVTLRTER